MRHELLFYLAFAVLLFSTCVGMALFGLWVLAVIGQWALSLAGSRLTGIASFYLAIYALNFFLGMALALLHCGRRFRPQPEHSTSFIRQSIH